MKEYDAAVAVTRAGLREAPEATPPMSTSEGAKPSSRKGRGSRNSPSETAA